MTTDVGSLISAGSVLLAVLGILFSLWYSEISEAQNLKPSAHYEDDVIKANRVHAVFKTKALPLSASATVVGFLLLPDALEIVAHAAEVVFTDLEGVYDAVSAALVALTLATFIFAGYGAVLAWRLWMLASELRSPRR